MTLNDEILSRLDTLNEKLDELVKQGVIHNHVLTEHERRSTNLETRFMPVEDDLKFRVKLYQICLGGGGLTAILGIITLLVKFFKLI
jgi:hypothetical protein